MKASIIIPCYNSEDWIEQSVTSALQQNYKDFEVIVVDNESTDRSFEIVNRMALKNDKLLLSTAPNIYPNCWDEARQEGFKISTGNYLFTLASDDILGPDYVSKYMEIFAASKGAVHALQSPILSINERNETGEIAKHDYTTIEQFKSMALSKCPVNSPTVVYSRKLYENKMLTTNPQKYGGAADYDLYCSLADNNIMIHPIPFWVGYYYRWHPGQATWNVHREGKNFDREIQNFWRNKWN
jgi:glycosyltransferase involved in cell wall biosynthesis